MTKFLKKTYLFLGVLLVISIIFNSFFYKKSQYPVNETYVKKHKYFINNRDKFNTIIFGSSRIYRQINPDVINNYLRQYGINSFNLAAPATFNPESYFLYEKLITENSLNIRYAFLEITDLNVIAIKNLFSIRTYYIADTDYLIYSFKYIHNSNRPLIERIYFYLTYCASFILNHVIPVDYATIIEEPESDPIKPLGFYSLNDELETGNEDEIRYIQRRHNNFLRDTSEIQSRINSAKRAFSSPDKNEHLNETHIEKLKHLISLSASKNIELYFIIPPMHKDYDEIADLVKGLPKGRVIILADYDKYPNIFSTKNMFDIGHLNLQGSNLLSKYLAQHIEEIIVKDQR